MRKLSHTVTDIGTTKKLSMTVNGGFNGGHLDMLQACIICIASIQGWNEPSGVGSEARQSLPWFAGFAESFAGTMHFM